uniref:Uncharacterized protein n=1 Tax=Rhizophora mucronata TaxID=61149 RepID=A0A2P2N4K3_RHIMU
MLLRILVQRSRESPERMVEQMEAAAAAALEKEEENEMKTQRRIVTVRTICR